MNNHFQSHNSNLQQNIAQLQRSPTGATTPYGYQILPANAIVPNGYYTATTASTAATGVPTTTGHHPNTILITNNFSQQPSKPQSHNDVFNGSNIRIISTTPNVYSVNRNNNNNNNITKIDNATQNLPTAYTNQNFAGTTLQQYYLPATSDTINSIASGHNHHDTTNAASKLLTQTNSIVPLSTTTTINSIETPSNSHPHTAASSNNANSTVVLDRINICINNHYTDTMPANICSSPNVTLSSTPSPIIPAIHHKPIIDSSSTILSVNSSIVDSSCSSSFSTNSTTVDTNSTAVIVIDEPDSTTTAHTPPTTPDTPSPSKSSLTQSPSSTTTLTAAHDSVNVKNSQLKNSFAVIAQTIKSEVATALPSQTIANCINVDDEVVVDDDDDGEQDVIVVDVDDLEAVVDDDVKCMNKISKVTQLTPISSSSLEQTEMAHSFKLFEDVFIKRQDERFYLGTIIDIEPSKYLVRFDDLTELWCVPNEMRKLGSASENNSPEQKPMCVACKSFEFSDIVEVCERCGRGYHRNCTTELFPGSSVWYCKRCAKPMKLQETLNYTANKNRGIYLKLPYHADRLSWDEKHRVNDEQIYCYCGRSGKFDHNMLQCCKCRNWFHTECMQNFKSQLLRGDSYFVFCCTVCNKGKEFLRRLQIDWVDVLHLTLYNLRKHQHQKYHHLLKDIWPFMVDNRHLMPIKREWREMPETALMEQIKQTLKQHAERFVCGREVKREHSYYGLRHNGPPVLPNLELGKDEVLTDELIVKKYKLQLLPGAPENILTKTSAAHEFHLDDNEVGSSEDEIPIKQIIDKAKMHNKTGSNGNQALDVADDNANDASAAQLTPTKNCSALSATGITTMTPKKLNGTEKPKMCNVVTENAGNDMKSSRKRKAFRPSKTYREIIAKHYDSSRNCDVSSDENSSSSRGTSLDFIIPPPVNFLGRNNPFLMTSPEKDSARTQRSNGFKSNILNSTSLDFSSNLAHLKSSGMFSNLSTSNLARAAGQSRTVRTIKRRLSVKDITIGPNQEVRRRRTRHANSDIEVISTTTINPIPSNFFSMYAKDLNMTIAPKLQPPILASASPSSTDSLAGASTAAVSTGRVHKVPTHGRLLRQRPQKNSNSPGNSRRSSTSSNQSSSTNNNSQQQKNSCNISATKSDTERLSLKDIKQTVNSYFGGAINRIQSGESFTVRAKRRLPNGQIQYLIEWGEAPPQTSAVGAN